VRLPKRLQIRIQQARDFFDFVFNWEDIKATVNAGLDFGYNFLLDNRSTVTNFMDGSEAKVLQVLKLPDGFKSKNDKQTPESKPDDVQNSSVSAPANVGNYHFEQAKNANPTSIPASSDIQKVFLGFDGQLAEIKEQAFEIGKKPH
jgi:hypothetical protein